MEINEQTWASLTTCCLRTKLYSKTWTGLSAGTLANNADPDQLPQNTASDQDMFA